MDNRNEFLNAREVAQKTGLHPRTLDRRLREGIVQTYTDPLNRHWRLIHIDDLPKLTAIEPRERRTA